MPDTTTQPWKVGDKALVESWGPNGPAGQWHKATIFNIAFSRCGPYYHLRCHGLEIVRSARELKRPTSTEPATCHKARRLVGIHVRVDPPKRVINERNVDALEHWAKEFCRFVYTFYRETNPDNADYNHAPTTIEHDHQDQCSACGKEWTASYVGMHRECIHCRARIDEKEPTP